MTDAESHIRECYPPRGQLLGHAGILVGNPLCGAATMPPRHLTGGSPYPARRTCGVRGRVLTGLGQPYGTRALPGPPRTGRAAVRCATRADVADQADGATAAGDWPTGGGWHPAGYCALANGLPRPAAIPTAPRTGTAEAREGKNISAQHLGLEAFGSRRVRKGPFPDRRGLGGGGGCEFQSIAQ